MCSEGGGKEEVGRRWVSGVTHTMLGLSEPNGAVGLREIRPALLRVTLEESLVTVLVAVPLVKWDLVRGVTCGVKLGPASSPEL